MQGLVRVSEKGTWYAQKQKKTYIKWETVAHILICFLKTQKICNPKVNGVCISSVRFYPRRAGVLKPLQLLCLPISVVTLGTGRKRESTGLGVLSVSR